MISLDNLPNRIYLDYEEYLQLIKLSFGMAHMQKVITDLSFPCRYDAMLTTVIEFDEEDKPFVDPLKTDNLELALDALAFGTDTYFWLLTYAERKEKQSPYMDLYQKMGAWIGYADD